MSFNFFRPLLPKGFVFVSITQQLENLNQLEYEYAKEFFHGFKSILDERSAIKFK